MTLTVFLLARLADDEAEAAKVPVEQQDEDGLSWWGEYGHLSIAPSRVLAECDAKRRMVALYQLGEAELAAAKARGDSATARVAAVVAVAYEDMLRLLALPFAGHPDYDEAWRP